jgi:hypothetical protein
MPLFSRRTRALCFSLSRSRAAVNLKSINFTAAAAFFARNVQINYTRELKHKIERRGDKKDWRRGAHHSLTREFRDTRARDEKAAPFSTREL